MSLTLDDVLASYQKHGHNMIVIVQKDAKRTPKQVCYVNVTFKKADGTSTPFNVKIPSIANISSPGLNKEHQDSKTNKLGMSFRELEPKEEEILTWTKSSKDGIITNTKKFISVLKIINDSFEKIVAEHILDKNNKTRPIEIVRTLKQGAKYLPFVQTHRKLNDKDDASLADGNYIEMKNPLYRLKVVYNPDSGLIERNMKIGEKKIVQKYIFDGQAMKDTGNRKVAMVGKAHISVSNVKQYLKYLSIIIGECSFSQIIVSSQGVSIANEVKELFVFPNPSTYKSGISGEEYQNSMAGLDFGEGYSGTVEAETEPEVASIGSDGPKKHVLPVIDNEPEGNDIEEEPEVVVPKKATKANQKKKVESEYEDDD